MIAHKQWRAPYKTSRKPKRAVKPDPERTRSGLLARIVLLEHDKARLLARVAELEEKLADAIYPDLDINEDGQFFYRKP